MVDYDKENDKDKIRDLDDDKVVSHGESRPNVFQFNNNCPSLPEELVHLENKGTPEAKNGEGSENKNIEHHQNLNGNSKNLYDKGGTIRPLTSKDNNKEDEKISKSQKFELNKHEKEQKKKEKENKKLKENKKDILNIEQEKREKTFMSKYI